MALKLHAFNAAGDRHRALGGRGGEGTALDGPRFLS
jgi:hypothetical protein